MYPVVIFSAILLQKQKWSVLLVKGVVGFVFELLFCICPKSGSSTRNYFLPAFVETFYIK